MSNFLCSLTSNITSNSMRNLAFHSLLRWKMIMLPILITSPIHFSLGRLGECSFWTWEWKGQPNEYKLCQKICVHVLQYVLQQPYYSCTKGDQIQLSPTASPDILHHTVWGIWLFMAYSDKRWFYYPFSPPHLCFSLLKGWENVLFELGSERVNLMLNNVRVTKWISSGLDKNRVR